MAHTTTAPKLTIGPKLDALGCVDLDELGPEAVAWIDAKVAELTSPEGQDLASIESQEFLLIVRRWSGNTEFWIDF